MKVEFTEDGSCWVEVAPGRKRWYPPRHRVTLAAKQGLTLDLLSGSRRAFAQGTHEPVVYYRDEEGKVSIPPDAQVPKGFDRMEIKTLRDADRLCREMSRELKERFSTDNTATIDELHRDANGNLPRDVIVKELNNSRSDYGREVMRGMLETMDQEEADRKRVSADVRFRWRES